MFDVLTRFVREISEVTDETLIISFCILLIVTTSLISYWFYNRRKFRELSHQIPASVLKNYLDSIIQNSNALKSSLFRGGGLEVGEGIPSVFPTGDLPASGVAVGGASSEELNQKNAEIASLSKRLVDKDSQISDLNVQLKKAQTSAIPSSGGGNEEVAILQGELEELRNKLAAAESAPAAGGGGGDTAALEGQLATVTKERDELKERLMEYEIIEEDLANLKRLQQENEQLKATIAQLQGGEAPAAPTEEAPAPEAEAPAEEAPAAEAAAPDAEVPEKVAEGGDDLEAQMAAAIGDAAPAEEAAAPDASDGAEDIPANEGEQKSAEELLSEFEKMLG